MKVLKFEASWCQPCKALSRVIAEMGEQLFVPVEAIDIDDNVEMAKQYGIRGVPTMVLLDNDNKEVRRVTGLVREAQLLEFIKQ